MNGYKRNQVEEAIWRTSGDGSSEPNSTLRTQLKRLLETDRDATRKALKSNSKIINYAFYSEDAPGSGTEVQFSAYEAFALETGLRLLDHGWPQGFVVRALRHIRRDFEEQHARILKQNPHKLFDAQRIATLAQPGAIGVESTDPVFLTLVTGKETYEDGIDDKTSVKICRGMEAVSRFVKKHQAHSWSFLELTKRAHGLKDELALALPRMRGRNA
jgi:hypothetical protein